MPDHDPTDHEPAAEASPESGDVPADAGAPRTEELPAGASLGAPASPTRRTVQVRRVFALLGALALLLVGIGVGIGIGAGIWSGGTSPGRPVPGGVFPPRGQGPLGAGAPKGPGGTSTPLPGGTRTTGFPGHGAHFGGATGPATRPGTFGGGSFGPRLTRATGGSGTVSAVSGTTVTIKTGNGKTVTVKVPSNATVTQTSSSSLAGITDGVCVRVTASTVTGKLTAHAVEIEPSGSPACS